MEAMEAAKTVRNKQVLFRRFITGAPTEENMELRTAEADIRVPAGSGAVLLKNLFLSCDPYMRGRMREYYGSYIPPFQPGKVIEGFGVSKVIDSENPNFSVDDLVYGMTGWEEYSLILKVEGLRKIEISDIPQSYYLGLLANVLS